MRPDLRGPALAAAGVAFVIAGNMTRGAMHAMLSEWGMILLSAAFVLSAVHGRAATVLSWRPLVAVGVISYGVYVWHPLIPKIVSFIEGRSDVGLRWPVEHGWLQLGYIAFATLMIATASWFLFEKPLNDLKSRIPYVRKRADAAALSPVPLP